MNTTNLVSPAGNPDWKLVDAAALPDCVPVNDDSVVVYQTEAGVRFVRTPEERFANLPGYSFAPNYALVEGLRMHYVDEGPATGEVVLLLHGQPTWSYLYRKMIPAIAAAGYRVIAVDHIGMGRSDKPVELSFHTFEKHVQRLKTFIAILGLKNITLFCQDWGSLMGLRVAGDQPERFARIIVANGTLPVIPKGRNPFRVPNPVQINCSLGDFAVPAGFASTEWATSFQQWILYALTAPNFTSSHVVAAMATHSLTPEEKAAYDAPYPSFIYKAAVRSFPSMIAALEEQNAPAWRALGEYQKPFLFLAGEHDHNMGSAANQQRMSSHIPGARGQAHERFEAAGHFIQEDIGEILGPKVVSFMQANPLPHDTAPTSPTANLDMPGAKMREQMHGARYGEVLLVTGHLNHVEAAVYNTLGFNDCPDDLWKALDAEEIKKEYKVRAVILNGPRYFLMDKTTIANVGDDIRTFGSLRMRRLATVKIPLTGLLGGLKRKPYTENIVERTTIYIYNSGREIYELVAPDGTTYIMQTYALSVDSTLTEEGLKTLAARLNLPAGWHYRVRQLDQECVLRVNGQAHLIQDEFENSYQRVD